MKNYKTYKSYKDIKAIKTKRTTNKLKKIIGMDVEDEGKRINTVYSQKTKKA